MQVIDEENIEKNYFMADLQRVAGELSQLKQQREDLRMQLDDARRERDRLEIENRHCRAEV